MTERTDTPVAIAELVWSNRSCSDRALVLALEFFKSQSGEGGQLPAPGELLEVAALIEGYLTGAYRVEFVPSEPVEGQRGFSLFGQVRAVLKSRGGSAPTGVAEMARQIRLREQAEAMLEEKAWQLSRLKGRFQRINCLNWFLAAFTLVSGLLELRLCGWL